MEEEQRKREATVAVTSPPKLPPAVPPKPSYLKQKRNSDYLEALQALEEVISKPAGMTRKSSAHSLFNPMDKENQVDEENNFIPSYLDRTQSCSNLVMRQKSRSKDQEEENNLKKYPSVKIDPSPLLPNRSTTSLNSMSALTAMLNEKRVDELDIDYDDITAATQQESDYDRLKENEKPSVKNDNTPKAKNFSQIKNLTSVGKPMRNLFNFLSSLNAQKLSLLITIEDCKAFKVTNSSILPSEAFKKIFEIDSKPLREEIMDRNVCLQLIVLNSLQKSSSPKDFGKLWIMTSLHLLYKIGNGFAFGAIMAVLKSFVNKKTRFLSELDQQSSSMYKKLVEIYENYLNGKMPEEIPKCFLPFVQPLIQLFSKSDYVHSMKTKDVDYTGLDNLGNYIFNTK